MFVVVNVRDVRFQGANRDALDREGHSALDLAVANGNAEVVTLIRLDRFRDDLKLEGSDFSSGEVTSHSSFI